MIRTIGLFILAFCISVAVELLARYLGASANLQGFIQGMVYMMLMYEFKLITLFTNH